MNEVIMHNNQRYGNLRKHQHRAIELAGSIIDGAVTHKVLLASITPGGGKTLMASLFANELADAGVVEQVLVVVPNDPLRQQMRESFHDPSRGLDRFLTVPTAQNQIPGTGRPFGKVITYQSLVKTRSAKSAAKWCSSKRTLLIFDECHHLCEDKSWERGAARVVEASHKVLAMTGTLRRWDEEKIPFIRYDENKVAITDLRYSRAEALSEKAVLPVEFKFFDGEVLYEHRNIEHETTLSTAAAKEQPRALKTALLSGEYAEKFIVTALRSWELFRNQYYPSSAIVVCHSQKAAHAAFNYVRTNFPKHSAALSLHNASDADKEIKRFRAGERSILVTVRKAYEGLDVPNATHLVYLGDSRSWPFLDQVIARVTRFDRGAPLEWEEQRGYVYVPNDRRMGEYVDNMLDEQAEAYREKQKREGVAILPHGTSFKPDSAMVTEERWGFDGRVLTPDENHGVNEVRRRFPLMRAPLSNLLEIAYAMGFVNEEAAE